MHITQKNGYVDKIFLQKQLCNLQGPVLSQKGI